LPWQDQETDRPAWRRNEKASCGGSRIRWMPPGGLVDHLGQGRDGEVGQLPGLEAGPKPSTGVSSGAEAGRRSTTSQDRWVRIQARMARLGWAGRPSHTSVAISPPRTRRSSLRTWIRRSMSQLPAVTSKAALGAATSYAVAERGRHRRLLPVERVGQCRWLAARRPAPTHLGVGLSAPSSKRPGRLGAVGRVLDPRPVVPDPAVDRCLVALGSAALGSLDTPAQPVAHPGHPLDHHGDAVKGPQLPEEPVHGRPFQQGLPDLGEPGVRQPWRWAVGPRLCKPSPPPACQRACQTLTAWAETPSWRATSA
jgi:hypothetical protein